jgi:hypothetical protein
MKEKTGFSEIRYIFYQTNIPKHSSPHCQCHENIKFSHCCRDLIRVLPGHRMEQRPNSTTSPKKTNPVSEEKRFKKLRVEQFKIWITKLGLFGFCPSPWSCSQSRAQNFGKRICFCPQVKRWRSSSWYVSDRKSCP